MRQCRVFFCDSGRVFGYGKEGYLHQWWFSATVTGVYYIGTGPQRSGASRRLIFVGDCDKQEACIWGEALRPPPQPPSSLFFQRLPPLTATLLPRTSRRENTRRRQKKNKKNNTCKDTQCIWRGGAVPPPQKMTQKKKHKCKDAQCIFRRTLQKETTNAKAPDASGGEAPLTHTSRRK